MLMHGVRDEYATRFGQCLKTHGDYDAIAIQIAPLDHHIAEIDADAQYDALLLQHPLVCRRHPLLELDRTGDRIDRAGELDQYPVTHHLDDAAVMIGDHWLQDTFAPLFQCSESSRLVLLDEAAVADHVGGQDGGQAALGAFFGHMTQSPSVCAAAKLYWRAVSKSIGLDFRIGPNPAISPACRDSRQWPW